MAIRPGDYITAKCKYCNDITGHVVTIIIDGIIAKVECKACGRTHKYKEITIKIPKSSSLDPVNNALSRQSLNKAATLGAASGKHPQSRVSLNNISASKSERAWNEAMLRHNNENPLPYSMAGSYTQLSLIEHSLFGRGEVISLIASDKMSVLFQNGIKILRCKP